MNRGALMDTINLNGMDLQYMAALMRKPSILYH